MWFLAFSDYFVERNLRAIHVVANGGISSFRMSEEYSVVHTDHSSVPLSQDASAVSMSWPLCLMLQ